ncbi:calcium/sodium antiporter [Patescibacteria group bacterium]|nr:calcium/sodium antiporter [Patescibacteria group bacterium]
MTWSIIFLIIGFVLLIKGADLLVDGASSLAKRLKIPALVIGLTIVAFGTSMPELIVNLLASLRGNTDIAIGNVLGSNISNILLIIGIASLIYPLAIKTSTVWKEIPLALLAVAALGILANDKLINKASINIIDVSDGIILGLFFLIFLYYVFEISRNKTSPDEVAIKQLPISKSIALVIIGIIGLSLGGNWVVDSAVALAKNWGISESLIGLTIVAIGTSLPELFTSVVAAWKKNPDIAIGNVVGSNIFNILWIVSVSAIVKPLPFNTSSNIDLGVTMLATILLFLFTFIGQKRIIERWQGALFVISYIVYIVYLVIKG